MLYIVYFFMDKALDKDIEGEEEEEAEEPFKFSDLGKVFGTGASGLSLSCVHSTTQHFPSRSSH